VQAQIMDLLAEIREEVNAGLILITHDLGVVADVAERILVMYAGRTMERGSVDEIYTHTANPYTYGLMASLPKLDVRRERLPAIAGLPPSLYSVPAGCAFNPRCTRATDQCRQGDPPALIEVAPDHISRCWYAEEVLADAPSGS
jgi:oligopeptide transport system ATP-binding protein